MNEIKIRKADNGFILTERYWDGDNIEEGLKIKEEIIEEVIEEADDEKEALKRLLLLVAEKFGYMEDKYGKENLRISFDGKGRKVENAQND